MSDPFEKIERLAVRARQADAAIESPEVSAAVLRRLREVPEAPDRPLWWLAGASMALAVLTFAVNVPALLGTADTAAELAMYTGWLML